MIKSNIFTILILFTSFIVKAQNFELVGDAFAVQTIQNNTCTNADKCFTLTPNLGFQQGAVWDLDTLNLLEGFDATFCMFIGNSDSGADGFAFVLRALNSNNYGDNGGGLGYGANNANPGISPSVAIEFDSFYNSDYFDIPADHTQMVFNGAVSNTPAVSAVPLLPNSANVEDNNFHTSRIVWNPTLQQMQMYFDGNLRFTYNGDIIADVFLNNPLVYWGFTASTGGSTNLQQICFPKPLIELPDETICENDSTLIHFYAPNLTSYSWTNPANQVIKNWDQSMGVPLTDTSFYASEMGDYTLTVEFNNQFFSSVVHVDIVPLPQNLNLTVCGSENVSQNLYDEFTDLPQDGVWQGPSPTSNGYLGAITPSNLVSGTYIYNSPIASVCTTDNQISILVKELIFNGEIELVPCTEKAYQLVVNPILSPQNATISFDWLSTSAELIPNQNELYAEINANSTILLSIEMGGNPTCVFDTTFNLLFVSQGQLNLGADRTICAGDDFLLNVAGNWSSYLWNDGSVNNNLNINQSGIYWCEVTSLVGNCIFRDTIEIFSSVKPNIILSPFDSISCVPFALNFEASSDLPNVQFNWNFGDGITLFDSPIASHTYVRTGFFDLTIEAIVQGTCINTLVLADAIQVINRPQAQFSYEVLSSSGGTNVDIQFINISQNYSDLLWNFSNGSNSLFENPVESFSSELNNFALAELLVSNDFCSDSVAVKIVFPELLIYYVPNTFTPDGNKFNNVFQPIITEGMDKSSYKLSLFNRWGELLFESFDTEIGWDGTYGGKLVENGIYVWKISFISNLDQSLVELAGHVQVLK